MIQLGFISNDFTCATGLVNNLVGAGFPVLRCLGVPDGALAADTHGVVVALKSRSVPPTAAVVKWLDGLAQFGVPW